MLAALLHDVGKPSTLTRSDRIRFHGHAKVGARMTREIGARLRLPRDVVAKAADLVAQHLRFIDVQKMKPATLKRFLRQPDFADHLELHRLDCLASHGDLSNHAYCLRMLEELDIEQLAPAPLLSGRDLMAMGYPRGPVLGRILRELETRQLEGALSDRASAESWVRKTFPQQDD